MDKRFDHRTFRISVRIGHTNRSLTDYFYTFRVKTPARRAKRRAIERSGLGRWTSLGPDRVTFPDRGYAHRPPRARQRGGPLTTRRPITATRSHTQPRQRTTSRFSAARHHALSFVPTLRRVPFVQGNHHSSAGHVSGWLASRLPPLSLLAACSAPHTPIHACAGLVTSLRLPAARASEPCPDTPCARHTNSISCTSPRSPSTHTPLLDSRTRGSADAVVAHEVAQITFAVETPFSSEPELVHQMACLN
jgi:hypothetical protein